MKPRFKPLKNLYFQFIESTEFEGVLNWNDVAEIFQSHDLIRLAPDKSGEAQFKGYFETEVMRKIPKEFFKEEIKEILIKYVKTKETKA